MAYTTQAQVTIAAGGATRLLQICDQDANGSLDADVLAQAQQYADMLIDGHSRMRFAALLDSGGAATETAIALASAETVYQLKCMIGQNSENDDRLAAARLALYEKIGSGTFIPDEPAPAESTNVASDWVDAASEGDLDSERMSREALKGFW